jgi:hypothetical protein
MKMRAVAEIIDRFGGIEKFRHVKLHVEGFMPLTLEKLPIDGPNGGVLLSVCHYFEQNGDLMADPEIEFEIRGEEWLPISFRQDSTGTNRIVVQKVGTQVLANPHILRDLQSFCRVWDKNIHDQGFMKAEQAKR